jgi:hypothetical protein
LELAAHDSAGALIPLNGVEIVGRTMAAGNTVFTVEVSGEHLPGNVRRTAQQ